MENRYRIFKTEYVASGLRIKGVIFCNYQGGIKLSDQIKIDSHKLMLHPKCVSSWLDGDRIYPIEMEIGLSSACNHRCIFCAVDYMEYKPQMLKPEVILPNLKMMAKKGLKSIIYAGEGEPLVNKDAGFIINKTKEYGIDVAMSSNGVLLTKDFSENCLQSLSWIRFSIAGVTDVTYEKIHVAREGDLQLVLKNLQDAVAIKRKKHLHTTLGAQLLLLPENKDEVVMMAKMMREIGLDYFTVKPFSQHPKSKTKLHVDYSESQEIGRAVKEYETENFKVYFRERAMENLVHEKSYDKCNGLSFMAYMDAKGNVFPCIVFMGEDKYRYGNINEQSFEELWEGEKADKLRNIFRGEFIKKNCRKTCRLDEINKYLYELQHPSNHVNFI